MIAGVLHIHRAERADGLVDGLSEVLSDPLGDPMEAEVVAVPTRGVERWLSQRLSSRLGATTGRSDGVCANLTFPFPGRLVGGALAGATGVDPEADPWLAERSVWPLLEVVDASLDEPWLAPLAAHLGHAGTGANGDATKGTRRFSSVRHIADLYDRYGVHRPQMVRAWAAGEDVDGAGHPLPNEAAWQAELWRRLRAHIAVPSPAEALEEACAQLRADPSLCDVPARVSLFGLTRLPSSYLQVLEALASERQVHLFLLHPSPVLWERIVETIRESPPTLRRRDDRTAAVPASPLLASWGRDAREMQLVLAAGAGAGAAGVAAVHHHHPVDARRSTLLQRIQDDIRADRAPPGKPLHGVDLRPALHPSDRSVQIHACHGRARQVEVVRDAILNLLADDHSLEARDVIVMCPDIEVFAPLVHATFGADIRPGASPGAAVEAQPTAGGADERPRRPDLRVRLADRSLRQTNPVLSAVAALLALGDARVTASQVLDLAGRDPVRRRFDFDDDDLARIEEWVAHTGIRWGLDARHRAPFKLEGIEANTWRAGLDRVLLGVAMAEEDQRLLGGVLPLDDVDSGAIDLAGRFAELVDRLATCLDGMRGPKSLAGWISSVSEAVDALCAVSEEDEWQRAQVRRLLDDLVSEAAAGGAATDVELALPEVRALVADRLRGRPTRANFRTGHLTVCTLVPMRSVPHRVVCLLGLDDGMFPRRAARDGDDLIVEDPYVGDRDPRSEDRQLLLDALLAAGDHLVIAYTGRDERTNTPRPPAVPVGELLDVIAATVSTPARPQVVVDHPLQPFDGRNFTAGALVPDRAWSFDEISLAGAAALAGERHEPPPFTAGPLRPQAAGVVEVEQLVRFVQHPVKAFLRQRLGISVGDWSEDLRDELPVELDGLQRWGVGERLLEGRLGGAGPDDCVAAEIARGTLPPGGLAGVVLDEVCPTVEMLTAAAAGIAPTGAAAEPTSLEVNLRLPDGRLLVGTVAGVTGTVVRSVTFSRVAPKHRLAAWVRFLALTAAHPDTAFEAVTIGRSRDGAGKGSTVTIARVQADEEEAPAARRQWALGHLAPLVELYGRGMCEPLPLYCDTSAAYASAVAGGKTLDEVTRAMARAWTSDKFDREDKDPAHVLVLGGVHSLAHAMAAPPCADEQGDGWATEESSRFGRYARRLWDGLLSCEQLVDR